MGALALVAVVIIAVVALRIPNPRNVAQVIGDQWGGPVSVTCPFLGIKFEGNTAMCTAEDADGVHPVEITFVDGSGGFTWKTE